MQKTNPKTKADFNALVELATREQNYAILRPVIEKELLHYDLLFALDSENLLDRLTFQGGTALRLCYGAVRLSEDLDFVSVSYFDERFVKDLKECIETYIGSRYDLPVEVKSPKQLNASEKSKNLKVEKWQIAITTSPERSDIPKQKIKIEICNVAAYTRVPLPLKVNYSFLPDGYSDTLIMTENLDEIMADKLVSFVNNTGYVRHRDIWDLRWLKQQNAKLTASFILHKIDDYSIINYKENLNIKIKTIDSIINSKAFVNEMSRFLPLDVQTRTLAKDKFLIHLSHELKSMLQEVNALL